MYPQICRHLVACLAAVLLATADLTSPIYAAPLDAQASSNESPQSLSAVNTEVGFRCDTCTTSDSFVQAALTRYPRAVSSIAYVINLQTGVVKAVYLDWDTESRRQIGGHELAVDPLLQRYVSDVGAVYRENGNSLDLKLVVRGEGSVYWVRANGTTEELKGADWRIASGGHLKSMDAVDSAPPNSAPIDLRGYQFSEPAFSNRYPNFPKTSYDHAFNAGSNINDFVRDQTTDIKYGTPSGVINGTVSATASPGASIAVVSLGGGVTTSRTLTSVITVYVPMKDGGFALVQYDKQTGIVTLSELRDGQGFLLPTNHPTPRTYLPDVSLNFNQGSGNGNTSLNAFLDWTGRNGIPVSVNPTPWFQLRCTSGINREGTLAVSCKQPQ
ncbi:hypothetical protein [Dokdonella soli]|uniref:Uncharacterized protein n=1 Tax=Dokdonella soli TaxID=529810 RepID=A0ABP3TQM3_9GAMM